MSAHDRGVIREGFICAECHATFTGAEELLKHYENGHVQSGTIKALLGKAKQKLTKDISQSVTTNPFLQSSTSAPPITFVCEPQQPGAFRSHYEVFKSHRNVKIERYASEGNKLLIRLLKLCDGVPDDPAKRKAHEQSIVNWMDEKSVNRCPDCTESFNVFMKRKHHCRLCGSVLCNECSQFISLNESKLLTKALGTPTAPVEKQLPRRASDAVVNRDELIAFRVCSYCFNILANRKANYEVQESAKALVLEHNELKDILRQAEQMIPELVKIVDSLNLGESLYSVQQANTLRGEIIKLTEKVDLMSKRICVGQAVNNSDTVLRQRIRSSIITRIRTLLSNLPVIPGEEYLNELKSKSMEGSQIRKPTVAQVVKSSGWVGEAKDVPMVDDPIEQQIINLQEFIQQAKLAGKQDEVEILQQSLKELLELKRSV